PALRGPVSWTAAQTPCAAAFLRKHHASRCSRGLIQTVEPDWLQPAVRAHVPAPANEPVIPSDASVRADQPSLPTAAGAVLHRGDFPALRLGRCKPHHRTPGRYK